MDASKSRVTQHHELEDFRIKTYESSILYKDKMKRWHHVKILKLDFYMSNDVILYYSRLKLFTGKHISKWSGPFVVSNLYLNGAINLKDSDKN